MLWRTLFQPNFSAKFLGLLTEAPKLEFLNRRIGGRERRLVRPQESRKLSNCPNCFSPIRKPPTVEFRHIVQLRSEILTNINKLTNNNLGTILKKLYPVQKYLDKFHHFEFYFTNLCPLHYNCRFSFHQNNRGTRSYTSLSEVVVRG